MSCKPSPEHKSVVAALSSQSYNVIAQSVEMAVTMLKLVRVEECVTTRSIVHALIAHLFRMLLAHRRSHGEHKDANPHQLTLGDIREDTELFEQLVNDLNEELASMLRESDPKHDYVLHLLKVNKGEEAE